MREVMTLEVVNGYPVKVYHTDVTALSLSYYVSRTNSGTHVCDFKYREPHWVVRTDLPHGSFSETVVGTAQDAHAAALKIAIEHSRDCLRVDLERSREETQLRRNRMDAKLSFCAVLDALSRNELPAGVE